MLYSISNGKTKQKDIYVEIHGNAIHTNAQMKKILKMEVIIRKLLVLYVLKKKQGERERKPEEEPALVQRQQHC